MSRATKAARASLERERLADARTFAVALYTTRTGAARPTTALERIRAQFFAAGVDYFAEADMLTGVEVVADPVVCETWAARFYFNERASRRQQDILVRGIRRPLDVTPFDLAREFEEAEFTVGLMTGARRVSFEKALRGER